MSLSCVLILVLVEHTLRGIISEGCVYAIQVLILVLVEHTLRAKFFLINVCSWNRLNPCFSGTYSQRRRARRGGRRKPVVLILVLVEHTLRDVSEDIPEDKRTS